ncbi:hypothetical protein PC116_g20910 [Phytophthora cactorum]|uniref:PexRD2 WYL domain-containing protein n=2 Tax=Phytophthora cactorum TaxID=29920 RepID=A0A8T1BBW2_9STRA|nr:hypothetical protein PC113_g16870 [Phytophthora cactorum]KAG2900457.1 hypothetical protein PC115_g16193 [Phytophthora cactorum]KAG2996971.1 hypothetical protein PC119_g17761 [Phytophthora cactorum]KAG4046690.1 hypothetical protein PC123_g17933 [Phytophthora cactorum]KAG4230809.1 hypothetical protein PC116_g20910 [Phytophthora cactorum]
MRFSHVLVVIAAAFLATTDALSTSTETHAAQVASQDGPSQRLLRNHYTTGEDDEDSEARTLDAEKMKQMWEAGTTVDAYASKLKITNDIATAANSAKAMGKLAETHKFKKLMLYLNYVAEKQRERGGAATLSCSGTEAHIEAAPDQNRPHAPLTSHEREKSELNWRGKYTCSISLFVELRTANLCPSYTPLQSFQEIFFGNVRYFPCGGSIINNSKLQTKA